MSLKRLTAEQREVLTAFQAKVYEGLLKVEKGHVTTYRDLGSYIDCSSSQAIGQALKRNPFAPEIPCHRVVKSDLTLGGFEGSLAKAPAKKSLLENEGVVLHQNDKGEWCVDSKCLHRFT